MNRQRLYSALTRGTALGAATLVAFIAVLVVLVFAWGRNQQYTPEYVEHRVAAGMTLEQAAYNLGEIKTTGRNREPLKDGGYSLQLNRAGLGAWFAPQYEVSLEFDRTGRLRAGYAKVIYQLDDYDMALKLDDARYASGVD